MRFTVALLALSLLFLLRAADAPKPEAKPEAKSERALTEAEVLKFQNASLKIKLLQKKFDIEGYQKELQPISAEQEAVAMAACKSIGIPDNLVQTQCRMNLGVDADGKPQLGADGKPVQPRVWREVPPEPKAEKK